MGLEFTDRKGNKVTKPKEKGVINRTSAYGIAIDRNKIFLVKPTWKDELELPGGGIEHEGIFDGLKREFLEETGFYIELINKNPVKTECTLFYADDIDTFFISKLLFFLVRIKGNQNLLLVDKNEIRGGDWYDLDMLKAGCSKINDLHLRVIKQ